MSHSPFRCRLYLYVPATVCVKEVLHIPCQPLRSAITAARKGGMDYLPALLLCVVTIQVIVPQCDVRRPSHLAWCAHRKGVKGSCDVHICTEHSRAHIHWVATTHMPRISRVKSTFCPCGGYSYEIHVICLADTCFFIRMGEEQLLCGGTERHTHTPCALFPC